jgi:5'-3' exonuclease
VARKLLLIDGDQFVFTAAIAVERETRWDEDNHVLYSSPELAFANLEGMLGRIFDRFETNDHALTFSSSTNFRYSVDPTYKANRKGARKPLCYAAVRELCDAHYNTRTMEGLEADDIMGILATKPGSSQRIIISQDKDLKTIPGTLWDGKDLLHVSQEEADYNHLYQTLIGDSVDGFKGCPGVGPVKAAKILEPSDFEKAGYITRWDKIVATYMKAGLTEADALVQARLARILRWTDWNSDTKEPILWTP